MTKIILQPKKHGRISGGHPWVYNNEIAKTDGDYVNGDIVEVYDHHQHFLGKGYINDQSQIVVRILSRKKEEVIDANFFKQKIQAAWNYRQQIGYNKNCRVVFGEADGLPALVVDKFEDVIVIQTLALGIDKWKTEIVNILSEIFQTEKIYERNDASVRELEGMKQQTGFLKQKFDTKFVMNQDGIKFWVDVANGQKTGFFHDQRRNRLALQPFVKNASVLDACSYTGSFSMYAAKFGAADVEGIDISADAVAQCKANAALNNFAQCKFTEANVFDELKKRVASKQQYDVVLLDPPAFTKSRSNFEKALKGYKEINLRGIQLTKPGGYLVSSSCSHFIYTEEFKQVITDAASDAGRIIRQVAFNPQSPDHPLIWNIKETNYLKCAILQVL
jgi:23S rRNA (cytosine1962-C5)-methyltransferase